MNEFDRLRAAFSNTAEDETELIAAIEHDLAAEIDAKNGWNELGELDEHQRMLVFKMASVLLRRVAEFVTNNTYCDNPRSAMILAKRNIAWIWVLFPQLVTNRKGNPATLQELGGVFSNSRCWMSMLAEEFSRQFDYFNRNQKTLASRPVYAAAAKKSWVKRKAKAKSNGVTAD